MPDWLGHMAIGAATNKALRLPSDFRLLLLGTLIPDAGVVVGTLAEMGWLPLDPYGLLLVLIPFCSPFIIALLCLAAAFATDRPLQAFGLISLGAATHIAADILQAGHMEMLAYPFSFRMSGWALHHYGDGGDFWLSSIAALLLVVLRFFPRENRIRLSCRHLIWALLPLLLIASAIAWSAPRMEQENVYNLQWLKGNHPLPDGTSVTLLASRVVETTPPTVVEGNLQIPLVTTNSFQLGQLVSVWGQTEQDGVRVDKVVLHPVGPKIVFSLLGGILFLLYWIRLPWEKPVRKEQAGGTEPSPAG